MAKATTPIITPNMIVDAAFRAGIDDVALAQALACMGLIEPAAAEPEATPEVAPTDEAP